MTNAALDRIDRISSQPPIALPARPEPDAGFDEKLAYLIEVATQSSEALIERREFERNVLLVLRDFQLELARMRSKQ